RHPRLEILDAAKDLAPPGIKLLGRAEQDVHVRHSRHRSAAHGARAGDRLERFGQHARHLCRDLAGGMAHPFGDETNLWIRQIGYRVPRQPASRVLAPYRQRHGQDDDGPAVATTPSNAALDHSTTSSALPCAARRRRSASRKNVSVVTTRSPSLKPDSTTTPPSRSAARSAT